MQAVGGAARDGAKYVFTFLGLFLFLSATLLLSTPLLKAQDAPISLPGHSIGRLTDSLTGA